METFNGNNLRSEMNFSDLMSYAFENYKKVLGWSILFLFILLVITLIVSSISALISGYDYAEFQRNMNREILRGQSVIGVMFSDSSYLLNLAYSSILSIIISPLWLVFPYIMHKGNIGESIGFGDLFIGYQRNPLGIMILAVIISIISAVAAAMCILPLFFVLPLLYTAFCFMLFENSSPIQALKQSIELATKNYGTVLGFVLVSLVIAIGGMLLCGIGILITAPFYYCVSYTVYCAWKGVPGR